MATFRSWAETFVPPVLRDGVAGVKALVIDMLVEGVAQAVRAHWVGDPTGIGPAYDALGIAGSDLSLPRYAVETWNQHHARLRRAWIDWPFAGSEPTLIEQLELAGFPGAVIYTKQSHPSAFEREDWSQFLIFFPAGTHTVTAPAPLWGSFNWGDGTTYGPVGLTADNLATIRAIVRKFKPGHWVCREVVFEISGWTYGSGHTWGEVGLVWGGSIARVGV